MTEGIRSRRGVAVLVVAAVLGAGAGVGIGVLRSSPGAPTSPGSPSPSAPPRSTTSARPSASAPQRSEQPLLYADGGRGSPDPVVIHDGERTVAPSGKHTPDRVDRLARVEDGYLVQSVDPTSRGYIRTFGLFYVARSGATTDLGDVLGEADADRAGDRVVARVQSSGTTTVWSLPDARVVARWDGDVAGETYVGFAGGAVLISQADGDAFDVLRWDPTTGRTEDLPGAGLAGQQVSPDGSYTVGTSDLDALSSPQGPNSCLSMRSVRFLSTGPGDGSRSGRGPRWQTCDETIGATSGVQPFSPDGRHVLAVPRKPPPGTDFGPGAFVVLDSRRGPAAPVSRVDAPRDTLGAQWADDSHLYLYGTTTGNPGDPSDATWIRRCTLAGRCRRVARGDSATVLGTIG